MPEEGISRCRVLKDTYRDSMQLMQLSGKIQNTDGILKAAVMMGTPSNIDLLKESGLLSDDETAGVSPNDMVICLRARDKAVADAALAAIDAFINPAATSSHGGSSSRAQASAPSTIHTAISQRMPNANLALISVPGQFATAEALKALKRGLHVFLFSNNVSIPDEVELKTLARKKRLLVMGPDCGTAILDGVPLGFANRVRSGSVGLIGASGTGLQQVSCLIEHFGCGVSQVIGLGGRDLDERVGGLMMESAIELLATDLQTEVIVLVSKPPSPSVTSRILKLAGQLSKPVVVNFLGCNADAIRKEQPLVTPAVTLEEAAQLCAELATGKALDVAAGSQWVWEQAGQHSGKLQKTQNKVLGLYSGGTLCKEAHLILASVEKKLSGKGVSLVHETIDLGEDEYTVGRPHPMIDFRLRSERIIAAAADPSVAVVLLDVVLGYGAHDDPAGALVPAILQAKDIARANGRELLFVASVCCAAADPQKPDAQRSSLLKAGVILAPVSNAQAAKLSAALVARSFSNDKCVEDFVTPVVHAHHPPPRNTGPGSAALRLFPDGVHALNLGLTQFASAVKENGGEALQLEWKPPAKGDRKLGLLVARLDDDTVEPVGSKIKQANQQAMERFLGAKVNLLGYKKAIEVVPRLSARSILHAGPPVNWKDMCGPMRGAVLGAVLFEGWAATPEEAEKLVAGGGVQFAPCNEHNTVGPMAGVVSPSMWVHVVQNETCGNVAYATLNEGLGKVLRMGAYNEQVITRLHWINNILAPALDRSLASHGPLDLRAITAQALQMGDECHNRNLAATSLLIRQIAPHIVKTSETSVAVQVLDFLHGNNHFFLNASMAAAKAALDGAHGIASSSLVTVMARNGVEVGIRLSGTADWFTAKAMVPAGLYFPGYTEADANPDLGDSAITETSGIGGFAMAAAPAIVRFVGGSVEDATAATHSMRDITLGVNAGYTIPALDFAAVPAGIDVRRVVESETLPLINTGIAHREPGIGQIGAGIAKAPFECFAKAIRRLATSLNVPDE